MGGDCTKVTGHAMCRSGWRSRCLGWRAKDGGATSSSCHGATYAEDIRKADVEKYTPTDGCPGCTCILLGQCTVLPHTEECRARIVTLMQQDEEGKSRLSKRDEKNEAPERDVTADDAAGAPADKAVQASEERRDEGILPYPENPEERSSLKRAAPAEPSSSSTLRLKTHRSSLRKDREKSG